MTEERQIGDNKGDMSATQIMQMWQNVHGIKLTSLQKEKLDAAIRLIAEGCYQQGWTDAFAKIKGIGETDQERYDSVSVTGSGRQVDKEPESCPGCGCLDKHRDWCLRKDVELHGST